MFSIRLAALSGVLMCAFACGGGSSTASSAPSPVPGGPSSSVAIPVGAATLTNRAYTPDELNVAVGTTVTWMNADSVSHTSTSDAAGWNSGIVAPGQQFSVAFPTVRSFSYHCAIHPGMIGTVVVR